MNLPYTVSGVGVSDNDTVYVHCRLRGWSNNMDIPGQWQCGNCSATRCWPVRRNCYRCGAPRPGNPPTPAPWNAGKRKERNKVPLGRDLPLATVSREPQVVPPRGLPGAGVGTPPPAAESQAASEDLLKALELLQAVMSAEDFSKYEKMAVPPSIRKKFNLKTGCGNLRLDMLSRLLSLKLMPRNNGLCCKMCGNCLRL